MNMLSYYHHQILTVHDAPLTIECAIECGKTLCPLVIVVGFPLPPLTTLIIWRCVEMGEHIFEVERIRTSSCVYVREGGHLFRK